MQKIIVDNWRFFCSNHKLVEAAGGLVYNDKNQLLMIFRNGKWDLPKGKLEIGEDIESCSIREVEEECGIKGLQITERISDTYHTYELKGEKILKRTYWFKMKTNFEGELTPQKEEGITEVCWVRKENIIEKLKNSYGNIQDLFKNE